MAITVIMVRTQMMMRVSQMVTAVLWAMGSLNVGDRGRMGGGGGDAAAAADHEDDAADDGDSDAVLTQCPFRSVLE
eukprot:6814708-Pyramimonas_sp.AAC.1